MKKLIFLHVLFLMILTATVQADTGVTVNTKFPGGNALVKGIQGDRVNLAPDLRGGRKWFYWYIEAQVKQAGTVTFAFSGKYIGNQGPAVSTDSGLTWKYLGTSTVKGNSFTYNFTKKDEKVRFAVTIPYLHRDLDVFLKKNAGNSNLKKTVLTKSLKGRDVELLQIGAPGPGIEAVCFTCRHHACETTASYLLEGFMQAAIADTPEGKSFRKKYVLYIIPFVDKDGVELGDQGKGRAPHDHNRDYGKDSLYPEIDAIEKLAVAKKIKFLVDWHCPTLLMRSHQDFYFCGPKLMPPANFKNAKQWSSEIRKMLPNGAPNAPAVWLKPVKPKEKGDLCSGFFAFLPEMVMAIALEVPFASPGKKMDSASLKKYGEAFLKAWVKTKFYEPQEYTLTVKNGSAIPVGAHKSTKYIKGIVVNITADTPPAGKVFDAWSGDTVVISNVYDPTITISTLEKATTLTATYKDPGTLYQLTIKDGLGGGKYSKNRVVDIKASPAPVGQVFFKWQGDTEKISDVNNRSISYTMPAKNINISVQYRPIDQELIGWWKFDDKDGNVLRDSTLNKNDFKIKGFTLSENSCSGKVGNAVRFDGSDDKAIHPTLLNKMPGELTIACWVKPDATDHKGQQGFLTKTNKNAHDQIFGRFTMKGTGKPGNIKFVYRIHGPAMPSLNSRIVWEDDVWYHYAITWSADGLKFYINGELKASNKTPGPIGDGNGPFTLGAGFKGAIDDLRIYGIPLKEAEIKALLVK